MPESPNTYAALISAFTSLLTVVVHSILYERELYPRTSFLTARAYNHAVRQSRHPLVCQWVSDAISAVRTELLKGTVANVVFAIFHPESSEPLERWVFDVHRMVGIVPAREAETPFIRASLQDTHEQEDDVDMAEQFRAVLARVSTSSASLKPLPKACPFTLAIELKDEPEIDPPIGHPQPWIPAEPTVQKTKLDFTENQADPDARPMRRGEDLGGEKAVPLRAVRSGEMDFEVWIEESKAKLKLARESSAVQTSSHSDG